MAGIIIYNSVIVKHFGQSMVVVRCYINKCWLIDWLIIMPSQEKVGVVIIQNKLRSASFLYNHKSLHLLWNVTWNSYRRTPVSSGFLRLQLDIKSRDNLDIWHLNMNFVLQNPSRQECRNFYNGWNNQIDPVIIDHVCINDISKHKELPIVDHILPRIIYQNPCDWVGAKVIVMPDFECQVLGPKWNWVMQMSVG